MEPMIYNKDLDVVNIDDSDKEKLKEMIKNILDSDTNLFESDEFDIKIDNEKGLVLVRSKRITRVTIIGIPKSKYYGRKRNKMINTYHKY